MWGHWGASPLELLLVAAPAAWYALGVRALWREAGWGRGVSRRQTIAFGAGVLALLAALASPLDAAAEALFSAHMVQHLVLILVAAPLCALGAPLLPALWALPRGARRAVGRRWRASRRLRAAAHLSTTPAVVLALHVGALWFWHLPVPYQAALAHPAVHALEHLSFFGTALPFWWLVAQPVGRRRLSYGAAILFVAATAMQGGALGAVLMYARAPWYPAHGPGARAWGFTLLEDQQLAGLVMWVPAGFAHLAAVAALFLRWMAEDERRGRRSARARAVRAPRLEEAITWTTDIRAAPRWPR